MSWRNRSPKTRVGYWPLNGHADDVSGYGNDGTYVGTPAYETTPYGRQCGNFDLSGVYVDCGSPTLLDLVASFTCCVWVKLSASGSGYAFAKRSDVANGYNLVLGDGLAAGVLDGAAAQASSTFVSGTAWNHWAFTVDAAGTGLIIYVDGSLDSSHVITAFQSGAAQKLFIGARNGGGAPIEALISELQIFNVELSLDEINDVMRGHG